MLAFLTAFGLPGAGSGPGHWRRLAWPAPGLVLVCIMLTAGSVAVIWVAMNLILAKEPIGAWILILPGVAAAITVPVGRMASPGTPEPQAVGPALIPVDQRGTHDRSQIALLPRESRETGHPPRLVNHGCLSELGNGLPTVALDGGFWRSALATLAAQETEQGGVALISRYQGALMIIGAVFPAQVGASSTYCEFSTADVDRVRQALDHVADDIGIGPGEVSITWVHTHPRLGVFLSGTDRDTSRRWRGLDPSFTPIVIDASRGTLSEQIGVFDTDERAMSPIGLVEGLVTDDMAPRLGEAILSTYHADGQPEPLVLLSGFREVIRPEQETRN